MDKRDELMNLIVDSLRIFNTLKMDQLKAYIKIYHNKATSELIESCFKKLMSQNILKTDGDLCSLYYAPKQRNDGHIIAFWVFLIFAQRGAHSPNVGLFPCQLVFIHEDLVYEIIACEKDFEKTLSYYQHRDLYSKNVIPILVLLNKELSEIDVTLYPKTTFVNVELLPESSYLTVPKFKIDTFKKHQNKEEGSHYE